MPAFFVGEINKVGGRQAYGQQNLDNAEFGFFGVLYRMYEDYTGFF